MSLGGSQASRATATFSEHARKFGLALNGQSIHHYAQQLSKSLKPNMDKAEEEDEEEMEEQRRQRRRRRKQKVVNCCKKFAAFLFSHIGLATMVVAYSIMGGFLFRELEAPAEREIKVRITEFKEEKIDDIWRLVQEVKTTEGSDRRPNFTISVRKILSDFQEEVRKAVKDLGWDGKDASDESPLQWSFAGALLYAVTVITTIGYGHVAPKTNLGRMLTIVYALIGIPLTFLYLSNIGNFMADCFRLFYKRICCDVLCCQQCNRKRKRERLRLRRRREMTAQLNIILGVPGASGKLPFSFFPPGSSHYFRSRPVLPCSQPQYRTHDLFLDQRDQIDEEQSCETLASELQHQARETERQSETPLTPLSSDSSKSKFSAYTPFHHTDAEFSSSEILETAIIDDEVDSDGVGSENCRLAIFERETAILQDESLTSLEREHPPQNHSLNKTQSLSSSNWKSKMKDEKKLNSAETDVLLEMRQKGRAFQNKRPKQKLPHYLSDSEINAADVSSMGNVTEPSWRARRGMKGGESELQELKIQMPDKSISTRGKIDKNDTGISPAHEKIATDEEPAKKRLLGSWSRSKWRHRDKSSSCSDPKGRTDKCQVQHSINALNGCPPRGRQALLRSKTFKEGPQNDGRHSIRDSRSVFSYNRRRFRLERTHSTESIRRCPTELHAQMRTSEESFVTAHSYTLSMEGSDIEDEMRQSKKAAHPVLSRSEPDLSRLDLGFSSIADREISHFDLRKCPNNFSFLDQQIRFMDDPFDYETEEKSEEKVTVPISICLVVIGGYIVAGSALFTIWEGWDYLTGSYFCFITLSTIGFGDIVPGTDMKKWASHEKLVLCALWLAFGLSLLAMCFNLMQEEVKDKCKWIGLKLGILNDENQT